MGIHQRYSILHSVYLIIFLQLLLTFDSSFLMIGNAAQVNLPQNHNSNLIWIARSDHALSCEPSTEVPLAKDAEELKQAGVPVLESKKLSDGKVHIQMCGASKGISNAFLIPKAKLSIATALGYSIAPSLRANSCSGFPIRKENAKPGKC